MARLGRVLLPWPLPSPCWISHAQGPSCKGQGPSLTLLLAAGRTKELSPERLERFTQFSKEQGLTDEEILILPQTGKSRQKQRGQWEEGSPHVWAPWFSPQCLWTEVGVLRGVCWGEPHTRY